MISRCTRGLSWSTQTSLLVIAWQIARQEMMNHLRLVYEVEAEPKGLFHQGETVPCLQAGTYPYVNASL